MSMLVSIFIHYSLLLSLFCCLISAHDDKNSRTVSHLMSVIANIIHQLWCFPKKCTTLVIPRFKIVDAYFTLSPRRVHRLFWWLLLIAGILIFFGVAYGGCSEQTVSYSYWNSNSSSTTSRNDGACASMVIGILLLLIPVPILLFMPCCFKL